MNLRSGSFYLATEGPVSVRGWLGILSSNIPLWRLKSVAHDPVVNVARHTRPFSLISLTHTLLNKSTCSSRSTVASLIQNDTTNPNFGKRVVIARLLVHSVKYRMHTCLVFVSFAAKLMWQSARQTDKSADWSPCTRQHPWDINSGNTCISVTKIKTTPSRSQFKI